MTDKHAQREEAAQQYLAQRYYLGQIGASTPIFLTLSTHDGEANKYDDGSDNCLAAWAAQMRTRYFPNPIPDRFYSGNSAVQAACRPAAELLRLAVGRRPVRGPRPLPLLVPRSCGRRLGMVAGSGAISLVGKDARFQPRQVRVCGDPHLLLCGDQASRGGVEIAGRNEWGGKNRDGSEGFREHRPRLEHAGASLAGAVPRGGRFQGPRQFFSLTRNSTASSTR